jgi:hypothetical protein
MGTLTETESFPELGAELVFDEDRVSVWEEDSGLQWWLCNVTHLLC